MEGDRVSVLPGGTSDAAAQLAVLARGGRRSAYRCHREFNAGLRTAWKYQPRPVGRRVGEPAGATGRAWSVCCHVDCRHGAQKHWIARWIASRREDTRCGRFGPRCSVGCRRHLGDVAGRKTAAHASPVPANPARQQRTDGRGASAVLPPDGRRRSVSDRLAALARADNQGRQRSGQLSTILGEHGALRVHSRSARPVQAFTDFRSA